MHDGTTQKWETERFKRVAQKAAWRLCRSVPAFEAVLESGRDTGAALLATTCGNLLFPLQGASASPRQEFPFGGLA